MKNTIHKGSLLYMNGNPIGTLAKAVSFGYNTINDFEKQLSQVKQITMNKKLIEQIEKIKGVKTVEPCDGRVVVTFEPLLTSVKVVTLEQLDFMWLKYFGEKHGSLVTNICVYATSDIEEAGFDCEEIASKTSNLIPFTQYLTDYNLTDEWEKYLIIEAENKGYIKGVEFKSPIYNHKYTVGVVEINSTDRNCLVNSDDGCIYDGDTGQWAEIIKDEPIELVKGEIYFMNGDNAKIFRFKKMDGDNFMRYSVLFIGPKHFYTEIGHHFTKTGKIKPATKKQKRKLIRAEVKNNYYHELNTSKG